MTLKAGDKIPDVTLTIMGKNGPEQIKAKDYFAGKKLRYLLCLVPTRQLATLNISPAFCPNWI